MSEQAKKRSGLKGWWKTTLRAVGNALLCGGLAFVVSGALMLSASVEVGAQEQGGLPIKDAIKGAKSLSGTEMVSRSETNIDTMEGVLSSTLSLLESTRQEEKDLLKLNCINAKLAAVKGFLKVSEQSKVKLQEALARNDRETAEHQYALVVIAKSKVSNLGVEAQSCAGEALRYSGNTEVTTEIDSNIAEIDPTILLDELETLYRLYESTPYL